MTRQLRGAAKEAAAVALVVAAAAIGLVWISIWAVSQLAHFVGEWAPLALGLLFCLPLAVYGLMRMLKAQPAQAQPLLRSEDNFAAEAADTAKRFFRKSPVAALAVAALAGLLAVRAPAALSPLLHLFDDERGD
jgi:hypothetical protein